MRQTLNILKYFLLFIASLIFLAFILIQLPGIQKAIATQVKDKVLSETDYNAIQFERLKIGLSGKVTLYDLAIDSEDKEEAILTLEKISVKVSIVALLRKKIVVRYIKLRNTKGSIYRFKNNTFNFSHLIPEEKPTEEKREKNKEKQPLPIKVQQIELEGIQLRYHDSISQVYLDADLGYFETNMSGSDLNTLKLDFNQILLEETSVILGIDESILPEEPKENNPNPLLPIINVGTIKLDQVMFRLNDLKKKSYLMTEVDKVKGSEVFVNIGKELIQVETMSLKNSSYKMDYTADTAYVNTQPTPTAPSAFTFSGGWTITTGQLNGKNNEVALWLTTPADSSTVFNPSHFDFNQIDFDIRNTTVAHEQITTEIKSVSAQDNNGLVLKEAKAKVNMNHNLGRFEVSRIKTNGSNLQAILDIHYPLSDSIEGTPHLNELRVKGQFTSGELFYFAPDIASYLNVHESTVGEIDIDIQSDQNKLAFHKANLYYPKVINISAKGQLGILVQEPDNSVQISIDTIILPSPNVFFESESTLPLISGKLDIQGELDSLKVKLSLLDNQLSKVEGDILLTKHHSYYLESKLHASIHSFAPYTSDSLNGKLSADINLHTAFNKFPGDSLASFECELKEVWVDSLHIKDIQLQANLRDNRIAFESVIAEKGLNFSLSGTSNMYGDSVITVLHGNGEGVNLQKLKPTAIPAQVNFDFNGDIGYVFNRGFQSEFDFNLLTFAYKNVNEELAPLNIAFNQNSDLNSFETSLPGVSVALKTNLDSESAIELLQLAIRRYINPTIAANMDTNKVLKLNCQMLSPLALENIIGVFVADTINIDSLNLIVDLQKRFLTAHASIPKIGFNGNKLNGLHFALSAKNTVFSSSINIDNFSKNQYKSNKLTFYSENNNGNLASKLVLFDSDMNISSSVPIAITQKDSLYTFGFNNDSLILGYDHWEYSNNEFVNFDSRSKKWSSNGVLLTHKNGSIEFKEEKESVISLVQNIDLKNWFQFITSTDNQLVTSGILSGRVTFTNQPNLNWTTFAEINIRDITILDIPYGDLSCSLNELGKQNYKASLSLQHNTDFIHYKGSFGEKSDQHHQADILIANISQYASLIDTNLFQVNEGGLKSEITLTNKDNEPILNGFIQFNNAQFYIPTLGAQFKVHNNIISLRNDGVHFENTIIEDFQGNKLSLNGDVYTKNYTDYSFDVDISSKHFQVLNSTSDQNENIYGQLVIRSDINIKGSIDAPKLTANIKILDKTNLTAVLPGNDPLSTESTNIVRFTNADSATTVSDSLFIMNSLTSVTDSIEQVIKEGTFDVLLTFSPKARFKIITNPLSGDYVRFGLSGVLAYRTIQAGITEVNGNIQIVDGLYEMSFYEMIRKEFEIEPSSTIYFSGPFSNTSLDIKAKHIVRTNSVGLMAIESSGISPEENALYNQRLPYELYFNIEGLLLNPQVSFALNLPKEYKQNSPMIASKLNQLSSPDMEQERNMQVFALLVTGGFIAENANVASSDVATATARNSVNSILSQQLNRMTSDNIKYFDMNLGLNTYDDYTRRGGQQTTDLDVQISKTLFDDRVSFEMESRINLDGTSTNPGQSSSNYNTDYKLYYNLNEKGSLQLKAYNLSIYDLFDGDITNTGVGIIFSKDFEGKERDNYVEIDSTNVNE